MLSLSLVKYFVYLAAILLIVWFLPKKKLQTRDILIIATAILLSFIILNCVSRMNNKSKVKEDFDIEHFDVTCPSTTGMSQDMDIDEMLREAGIEPSGTEPLGSCATGGTIEMLTQDFSQMGKQMVSDDCDCSAYVKREKDRESDKLKELVQLMKENGVYLTSDGKMVKADDPLKARGEATQPPENKTNENQLGYSEYPQDLHDPLGKYDDTFSNKFDHGFSYLDTDRWKVPVRRPPVCIADKPSTVHPVLTSGYPLDVKEWDTSRRVMPNDEINVEYVSQQLNKDM